MLLCEVSNALRSMILAFQLPFAVQLTMTDRSAKTGSPRLSIFCNGPPNDFRHDRQIVSFNVFP